MKTLKRMFILLIIFVLVGAMLIGCTPAAGDPAASVGSGAGVPAPNASPNADQSSDLNADIVFWSSYTETSNYGEVITAAARAFEDENPGVKIEISFQGTDIQSTLKPSIEAGTKITMFEANTDASMVLWNDKMMDLTQYYNATFPQTEGNTYENAILEAYATLTKNQGGGTYYYFPYTPQFVSIWYNKDIFDECGITTTPTTWEELTAICDTLVANGYTPFTTDQTHVHFSLGYYVERRLGDAAAQELVFDTTGVKWDDPAVLEIAQEFEAMAAKGYFADDIMTVVAPEAQQAYVIDRDTAMYVGGSWMPNNVRESAGPDFRWGNFAYPTVPNGVDDQSALCYGCYGISINKDATKEEADAAAAFAVYLTLGEWGQTIVDTCNAIPVSNSPSAAWPEMIADAQNIYDGVNIRYASQTAFALNNDLLPTVKSAFTKLMGGAINADGFMSEIKAYY